MLTDCRLITVDHFYIDFFPKIQYLQQYVIQQIRGDYSLRNDYQTKVKNQNSHVNNKKAQTQSEQYEDGQQNEQLDYYEFKINQILFYMIQQYLKKNVSFFKSVVLITGKSRFNQVQSQFQIFIQQLNYTFKYLNRKINKKSQLSDLIVFRPQYTSFLQLGHLIIWQNDDQISMYDLSYNKKKQLIQRGCYLNIYRDVHYSKNDFFIINNNFPFVHEINKLNFNLRQIFELIKNNKIDLWKKQLFLDQEDMQSSTRLYFTFKDKEQIIFMGKKQAILNCKKKQLKISLFKMNLQILKQKSPKNTFFNLINSHNSFLDLIQGTFVIAHNRCFNYPNNRTFFNLLSQKNLIKSVFSSFAYIQKSKYLNILKQELTQNSKLKFQNLISIHLTDIVYYEFLAYIDSGKKTLINLTFIKEKCNSNIFHSLMKYSKVQGFCFNPKSEDERGKLDNHHDQNIQTIDFINFTRLNIVQGLFPRLQLENNYITKVNQNQILKMIKLTQYKLNSTVSSATVRNKNRKQIKKLFEEQRKSFKKLQKLKQDDFCDVFYFRSSRNIQFCLCINIIFQIISFYPNIIQLSFIYLKTTSSKFYFYFKMVYF